MKHAFRVMDFWDCRPRREPYLFKTMLNDAIEISRKAGALLKKHFGEVQKINESHAHDIKLEMDVRSQRLIEEEIMRRFPDHGILGEEGNHGNPNSPYQWIVDPIDGTVNYTYGIPHYCVSIALRHKDEIILGVIYDPQQDELFCASKDSPARLNDRPIRVSDRNKLSEAMMVVGFSKTGDSIETGFRQLMHYAHKARKTRNMGSAALGLAYLAAGRLDGYLERGINLWDIAAAVIIIQQAGGRIQYGPNPEGKDLEVIASNGLIDVKFI